MTQAEPARTGRVLRSLAMASLRWSGPLLLAGLVGLPLIRYFGAFLMHPAEGLTRAYGGPGEIARLAAILARTAGIAALTATLALVLGLLVFVAFHPLRARWRLGCWALAVVPFFLPGHFHAIAWIQTVGKAGWLTQALSGAMPAETFFPAVLYSGAGCAWVLAMHLFPLALGMLVIGWLGMPASAIESARTMMRPGRLWRGVVLGWMRSWLAMGWLLVFIMGLLDTSVASLMRRHVYPVEIMSAFDIDFDPSRALALSLPLVAISLLAVAILGRLMSRADWPPPAARFVEMPPLCRAARGTMLAGVLLFVVPAVAVPVGSYLKMIGGWGDVAEILVSARGQIVTSLACSLGAAVAALALAIPLAAPVGRPGRGRNGRVLTPLMLGLFALPGSVTGMAQLTFWNRPGAMGQVFDSGLMLPLGLLAVLLPVEYVVLRVWLDRTPEVLADVERLGAGRPLGRWWTVDVGRLLRPGLAGCALVFVLAMQEVHATLLLAAPGQAVMSVRALTLLHNAPDSLVASFCLVTLGVMALGLAFLGLAGWMLIKLQRWW